MKKWFIGIAFVCLACVVIEYSSLWGSANGVTKHKLKAQIIQECDFREATVWDVVAFLNTGVVEIEPPATVDPATQTILVLPLTATNRVPLITLRASRLSTYDALRTVAELTGMKFTIENGRAWLRYKEQAQQRRPW